MRKALFLTLIAVVLAFTGIAIAADKIGTFGAPNASGTYPMEVTDARAITVASDATFTNAGTTSLTGATSVGALTATSAEVDGALVVDGTLYTATVAVDGALYFGRATLDPCATLGPDGWVFFNSSGEMCQCKAGADVKVADGSTACY